MKFLGRLFESLRSLRLTVVLMGALTFMFLMGVIVPQKDLLGPGAYRAWRAERPVLLEVLEFIGFTDAFTSPLTLALIALFFLNLLMVMLKRVPLIWRKTMRINLPSVATRPGEAEIRLTGKHRAEVSKPLEPEVVYSVLREGGYRVFDEGGGGGFWAVRNRLSPLATILFHLSFFLLLLGGIITFYTRFTGTANVAEGETFYGQYSSVSPPRTGEIPSATFRVKDVEPSYYRGRVPVDLEVVLETPEGEETMRINKPYRVGPLSFLIKTIDVAPLFILYDRESGEELDGAFFKMKGLSGGLDDFSMYGYDFRLYFITNYGGEQAEEAAEEETEGGESSKPPALRGQAPTQGAGGGIQKPEIVDPAVYIGVFKNGTMLDSETLRPGESLTFDGLRLLFDHYRYWVRFSALRERGAWVVYAGFALMTVALLWRFLFYRRELKGVFRDEGGGMFLSGSSEFYPSLFGEEFGRLVSRIEKRSGDEAASQ